MIRPAKSSDIERVVDLYVLQIENSLFAQIGPSFVRIIIRNILESEFGLLFVFVEGDRVVGFIASSMNTNKLFNEIPFRDGFRLAVNLLLSSIRKNPKLLYYAYQTFRYTRKTSLREVDAEFLYIAIDRQKRLRGISKELVDTTLQKMRERGVKQVKVSTEKDNEAAIRLLKGFGFHHVFDFSFYGKEMRLFCLDRL